MIIQIASIIVIIVLTLVLYKLGSEYQHRKVIRMSFKESLDLVGLPIITFKHNNTKLNFIVDTGAATSAINKTIVEHLDTTSLKTETTIAYGVDGIGHAVESVGLVLEYKENSYADVFRILDLTPAFENIKKECGVTVHGLLSSAFLERYKYVIDFKELAIIAKKNKCKMSNDK